MSGSLDGQSRGRLPGDPGPPGADRADSPPADASARGAGDADPDWPGAGQHAARPGGDATQPEYEAAQPLMPDEEDALYGRPPPADGPGTGASGAWGGPAPRPGHYPPPPRRPTVPRPARGGLTHPRPLPADLRRGYPLRVRGPRPVPSAAQRRLLAGVAARRQARTERAVLAASALISAAVLAVSGGAWALTGYVNGKVGRVDAGTVGAPSSGPLNILVAGVDRRDGLTPRQQAQLHVGHDVEANSDTMMLVHLSGDHTRVTVVSIPRDSWVHIPGHGMNKINAAYGLGGPSLTVRTVEELTGVVINDYIEVNFLGVVQVVDALGGVDICLPQAVSDSYSGLHLTAGKHHVDGITALMYARDRHSFATQDLARISDQQKLLASLLHQAISGGTLADPVRLSSFLSSVLAAVKVDRGLNVAALADQMRGINPANVTFLTVPLARTDYLTSTGQSAVLWDARAAARLFTAIRDDQPFTVRPRDGTARRASQVVVVDIYNGTLIGGLSSYTGAQLALLGFHVRDGLTWYRQDVGQTLIEYPPGEQALARQLGAALPAAALRQQAHLTSVRIILGVGGHELSAAAASGTPRPAGEGPAGQFGARTAVQNACR